MINNAKRDGYMVNILYSILLVCKKLIEELKLCKKQNEIKNRCSFILRNGGSLNSEKRYKESLNNDSCEKKVIDYSKCSKKISEVRPYNRTNEQLTRNYDRTLDLSIIIPAYNADKTLSKCLDSIFLSNLTVSFEVICVNDGSKDDTSVIMDRYCKFKEFVPIHQQNAGLSGARNSGLRIAKGRYIFFLDSDDFVRSKYFNGFVKDCINNDRMISVSSVGKFIERLNLEAYPIFDIGLNSTLRKIDRKYDYCPGTAWGKLYHYSLWQKIDFFEGYAYEDTIIFLIIWQLTKEIHYYNKSIYCFRTNTNSLFKRQNNSFSCLDSLWIVKRSVEYGQELGADIHNEEYYKLLLWHLSTLLNSRISGLMDETYKECAFYIASDLIRNVFPELNDYNFHGADEKVYTLLVESFFNNDFGLWKMCSGCI